MEIKRRRNLTAPGDTLLLAQSPLDNAYRFTEWRDSTGLSASRLRPGTLCSVPLPVYTAAVPGRRQFAEVRPEMMWHPLFWLPPRLAGRYNLPTLEGGFTVETDDMWSVRVALELTTSGIYSVEDGWLDILATVGLDVDDEFDVARIQEWQEGGVDDLLDSIDLDGYLRREDDEHWALQSAVALFDTLVKAQWALLSDSLIEMLQDAVDPAQPLVLEEVADTTSIVASLAEVQLGDVPVADDQEPAEAFWQRIMAAAKSVEWRRPEQLVEGPVAQAFDRLYAIRDAHWGCIDELQSLQTAQPTA